MESEEISNAENHQESEVTRTDDGVPVTEIKPPSDSLLCDFSQIKFSAKQDEVKSIDPPVNSSSTNGVSTPESSQNIKLTMILQYSKELLGLFALILTTYAAILSKDATLGGTILPQPIFGKDSLIQEWPYGNIPEARSKVAMSELSLIFFYAPWCAESLFARKAYKAVANTYKSEAYFGAINCWQPNSSCRDSYSNVYKWPVLMAYFPNSFSVQYNGAWNYHSLSKFIDRLLMPMIRINDMQSLIQLRITNDIIIFGIFKSSKSLEYNTFFKTAVRSLESPSFQSVKFAVFVGNGTSLFVQPEDTQSSVIKVYTTNRTMIYRNPRWVLRNILNILNQNITRSDIWTHVANGKSSAISEILQDGPALFMFLPKLSSSHYYIIMKQIAYAHKSYKSDLNNTVLNDFLKNIQRGTSGMFDNFRYLCNLFENLKEQNTESETCNFMWTHTLLASSTITINSTYLPNGYGNTCKMANNDEHCKQRILQHSYCKQFHSQPEFGEPDYRSPTALLKKQLLRKCFHQEKPWYLMFHNNAIEPANPYKYLDADYHGNSTLSFIILDGDMNFEYLRNFLGDLEFQHSAKLPALFIVDTKNETLYRHNGPITTVHAMRFVEDFYKNNLRPLKKSTTKLETKRPACNSTLHIREINSQEFHKVIHMPNVTTVVLFYSQQCSLCYIMSRILLQVSYIMSSSDIKFYRIDGIANHVRWEYSMSTFPTLIVFPRNRPSDSSVFPSYLEVTRKNVFGFILAKLSKTHRLKTLINACTIYRLKIPFQKCTRYARKSINNEIGYQLDRWIEYPDCRSAILEKLALLKEGYFELETVKEVRDLKRILKNISAFKTNWLCI